jgi:leader peptidase (prepilin peptidase) / N-methyltransferase
MPLAAAFAVTGALLGVFADRLAARWPAHEGGVVRARGWRTWVLIATGALAFGALALRWSDPMHLLVLVPYFALLLVLMATDLHQRLLPDVLTLPLIPVALVLLLLGLNPLLAGKDLAWISALAAGIGAPLFLVLTNAIFKGGLGGGDVKLAVGLGLMSGVSRLFTGFLYASVASAFVLVALIATRRLQMRSAIPFGPVLIVGGFLAALIQ